MKNYKPISKLVAIAILLVCSSISLFAQKMEVNDLTSVLHVQQYDRAIHIMAMLLIGFGFLMVFVRTLFLERYF